MNKTLNINLAGLIFHIDEDAFNRLEQYLNILKRQFSNTDGGNEIISDIETRIAELFREQTSDSKEVINMADVEQVIGIMGEPEDYLDAEEETVPPESELRGARRIFRDPENRIIGGVSSGLAAYFNIDPLWIRLLFVVLFFSGPGILIYIIMWIVVPKANTTAEKLRMRGEPVNISNIQRSIRDEMRGVEDSARNFSKKAANYDYSRSAKGVGGFFSDLGNFLLDAIRLIFNFLFKLIGIVFLAAGFVLLFAIVMSLFVGTVDVAGTEYGISHFFEFMHLVTENGSHYNYLMVSIVLSTIAPLFLLIYFGIRILFDLDPLNGPTKSALAIITFVGLVNLVVASVRIGLQFQDHGRVENKIALSGHQQYYLQMNQDSISIKYAEDYDANWIIYENIHTFNNVDVDIRQTEQELPYLLIRTESSGESRKDARNRAEEIHYEVVVEDSVIKIPSYFAIPINAKFRGQWIYVNLYLPEGYSVYFDESLAEYLDDVQNVQREWDFDMVNKLWNMTEYGLSCDGCKIPEEEVIPEDDEDTLDIGEEGIIPTPEEVEEELQEFDDSVNDIDDGSITLNFHAMLNSENLNILNKRNILYI